MLARPGFWLIAVVTWCSCAVVGPAQRDGLRAGEQRSLRSRALNEARASWVSAPDSLSASRRDLALDPTDEASREALTRLRAK